MFNTYNVHWFSNHRPYASTSTFGQCANASGTMWFPQLSSHTKSRISSPAFGQPKFSRLTPGMVQVLFVMSSLISKNGISVLLHGLIEIRHNFPQRRDSSWFRIARYAKRQLMYVLRHIHTRSLIFLT